VKGELHRMWKETVVAYGNAQSCHLTRRTEEKYENCGQDSLAPRKDKNQEPIKCRTEVLIMTFNSLNVTY